MIVCKFQLQFYCVVCYVEVCKKNELEFFLLSQLKEVIEKLHPLVKMARAGHIPKEVLSAFC